MTAELMPLIQAYGASMAAGDSAAAQQQLGAIQRKLEDRGEGDFAEYWDEVPGKLVKAGNLDEAAVRMVCELSWWRARQTLTKGDAHRAEAPKFLGANNAVQTRP